MPLSIATSSDAFGASSSSNQRRDDDDDEEANDDGDNDDIPVDLKSRCVIQIEEMLQAVVGHFKATASEMCFFSDSGLDYIDFPSWLKKPNPLLDRFVTQLAANHNLVLHCIENEEVGGRLFLLSLLLSLLLLLLLYLLCNTIQYKYYSGINLPEF